MRPAALTVFCLWLPTALPDSTTVELKPATAQAFDRYIRATEMRLDRELADGNFLWIDRAPERMQAVRGGQVLAQPVNATGDVAVPDGLVHDWIGAVFIPGATLAQTLAMVQDYDRHKIIYQPEVRDSRLLSRTGNDYKIFLRVVKKKVLKVELNTYHDVQYVAIDPRRCYSRSHATRIAEVENSGGSNERELPPGYDHGFLWRLDSYWRFEERDGGVYVECEAVSLSRAVPLGLGWLINPIIRGLPRDSLVNTLRQTRAAL